MSSFSMVRTNLWYIHQCVKGSCSDYLGLLIGAVCFFVDVLSRRKLLASVINGRADFRRAERLPGKFGGLIRRGRTKRIQKAVFLVEVAFDHLRDALSVIFGLSVTQVVESEVTDKASEKRNIVEEAVDVTDAIIIPVSAATITNVKGQGSKDKGKAKMIELEKPLRKKDQIKFDEEEA
ncbi:hypothetical protein Tco_0801167 [Tanacetum coccineum]|uniref:Uncharacterized protein n=1 Tax=Tanacetum coccineum TaxID=301880 RepID=A0ABQ4ZV83_9ASTR